MTETKPLLSVRGLKKYFPQESSKLFGKKSYLKAIDGIDFDLYEGETVGLVGESGCGKSTTARILAGIETPSEGSAFYRGKDLFTMTKAEKAAIRTEIQMIFQDNYASLNPRRRVYDILVEPLLYHHRITKDQADAKVQELLDMVGLPQNASERYPQEFSGGQRQRISIARALALEPKVLICDEPVSALDVSIQAQILNLLKDLQERLGVSYLFIAHGLGAVHYISDEIDVMYLGKIVEAGAEEDVFLHPLHPYTQLLIAAVPAVDPDHRTLLKANMGGEVPLSGATGTGCSFAPRCPFATERCYRECPKMKEALDSAGGRHQVACFHVEEGQENG